LLALVEKSHLDMCPRVPFAGWDVVLSTDPRVPVCLLEVNLSCNFFRGSFDKKVRLCYVGVCVCVSAPPAIGLLHQYSHVISLVYPDLPRLYRRRFCGPSGQTSGCGCRQEKVHRGKIKGSVISTSGRLEGRIRPR
jgi:hypothetical protein